MPALNKKIYLNISIIYVLFIGLSYCLLNIIQFLNIPFNFNSSISILSISICTIFVYFKYNKQNVIIELFISAFLFFVFLFFASIFYDYSYDGQMYHIEAVVKFTENWNPIYNHFHEREVLDYVYNHFAKSSWYLGAYLYLITGNINSIKSINSVWMINVLFLCIYFLKSIKTSVKISILLGLLISINPIFLNMYLSNMIDYQLGACILSILLFVSIYLHKKEKIVLFPIALIIIYFINLKITALVYIFIFLFGLIGYLIFKGQLILKRNVVTLISTSIISAVFIFGYHTYVKNYIIHGHIFYPMYGEKDAILKKAGMVDAMEYRTGFRINNIVKSHFASTTFSDAYSKPLKYKVPFSVTKYELTRYAFAGVMIGGFGVWFSGIILISFSIILFYFIQNKVLVKQKIPLLFLISTILVSVFINPLFYIARYVPQYYLIPIIALYISYHFRRKVIFNALLFILIVNSSLIMGYTYYNFEVTKKRNVQLDNIKKNGGNILVNFNDHRGVRATFNDNYITYQEVDSFHYINPDTFFRSNVYFKVIINSSC